ncbi:hypothetical protein DN752_19465 [Echinicola strongylocentroti]|uniref:HTH cro/C1-type domain-containing protein n=1 Tax=Echinicola strongylocentroti TaxID=1795355 RepID=A0A2Z4ILZ3_9BACT|nr:helix-turn-helix transcriptional regulator [Echinicola strongylocentroti]AWW32142.1 hypothetical protein DN752_19465 [Echinicola strongylocentroti]
MTKTYDKSLPEQIKNARENKGWSQSELAKYLGVSTQSVSKWELGKSEPKGENFKQLKDLFGIKKSSGILSDPNISIYKNLQNELSDIKKYIQDIVRDAAHSNEHYRDLVLENDQFLRIAKQLKKESDNHSLPDRIIELIEDLNNIK